MHALAATFAILTAGCNGIAASPTAPTPAPPVSVEIVPTVLRVSYAPAGVFAGGATQIRVGIYGYDAHEVLHRVSGVHVEFATDREALTVLFGQTHDDEDAVALLEVGRAAESYDVVVRVEAGLLHGVVRVPVCAC